MSNNLIINAKDLIKNFGIFPAVRGLSFSLKKGQCVGLLGPNGAGKSTTMRMIMGLCTISGGRLDVFGASVKNISRKTKSRIGLVPQENNLDPDITVRENLEVFGRYFSLSNLILSKQIQKLLSFMSLCEKQTLPVNVLSGGMKRRLIIARALINDPELVILDEPTTGLDPQSRLLIWTRLMELKKQGRSLLLTTHYMDEAQRLCDQIVVIDHGRVLDQGTPKDLIDRYVGAYVFEVKKPHRLGLEKLCVNFEDIGQSILYYTRFPDEVMAQLSGTSQYNYRPANLEDVFLRLTGRNLRDN